MAKNGACEGKCEVSNALVLDPLFIEEETNFLGVFRTPLSFSNVKKHLHANVHDPLDDESGGRPDQKSESWGNQYGVSPPNNFLQELIAKWL